MIFSRTITVRRFIRRVLREFPGSRIAQAGCANCRCYNPTDDEAWEIRFTIPFPLIDRFLQRYGDYVIKARRSAYPCGERQGQLQDFAWGIILAKGRVVKKRETNHTPDIFLPRTVEEYIGNRRSRTVPEASDIGSRKQ